MVLYPDLVLRAFFFGLALHLAEDDRLRLPDDVPAEAELMYRLYMLTSRLSLGGSKSHRWASV